MTPNRAVETGRAAAARLVLGPIAMASRWVGGTLDATTSAGGATSASDSQAPDPRYIALGVTYATGERLVHLARGTTGATQAAVRPVATIAVRLIPAPVRQVVEEAVRQLDEHGRSVAAAGAEEASQIAEAFADRLGQAPAMLHIVDRVVDHVQWRVVDAVLPVVLERLAAEPDQVRDIVLGQSRGMVEEITQTARARAVAGDEAVDRFLARLLRRRAVGREPPGRRAPVDVLPADVVSSEP